MHCVASPLDLPQPDIDAAKIHIELLVIRSLLDTELECSHGIARLSKLHVQDAEVVDGARVIALLFNGALKPALRFGRPILSDLSYPHLIRGIRTAGGPKILLGIRELIELHRCFTGAQ